MIFPISHAKYKILRTIYENPGIKISALLAKTQTSPKAGYRYMKELLKAEVITEHTEGEKPLLRTLKSAFTEAGITVFGLLELQKRLDFFKSHPKLKGPFAQFESEAKAIIECAVIFGSFARGSETTASDIDMAIFSKQKISDLEKIADRSFVTVKNRPSIRIFRTDDFIESLKRNDSLALQMVKDHVVVLNARRWLEITATATA